MIDIQEAGDVCAGEEREIEVDIIGEVDCCPDCGITQRSAFIGVVLMGVELAGVWTWGLHRTLPLREYACPVPSW